MHNSRRTTSQQSGSPREPRCLMRAGLASFSPAAAHATWLMACLTVSLTLTAALTMTPAAAASEADAPSPTATTTAAAPQSEAASKQPPRGVLVNPPEFNRANPIPEPISKVGVAEHRGDKLPLDLRFTDEAGKQVRLGDYLEQGKPVILNLAYYNCPMLCDLVMNGMADTLKEMKWLPEGDSRQFQIVTVSIDPTENHKLAAAKKKTYVEYLDSPASADGWHFLTGDQDNIDALAQAVGFGYEWVEKQQQFAHPAVLMIITPDGKVSRYLYGLKFPAKTLRLSLVEAADGKIGTPLDQFILACFHYDPSIGDYSLSAQKLMRAGGYLTVLVVASVIGFALVIEKRRRRKEENKNHGAPRPS